MRPALLLLVFIGIFGMLTNFIIYDCVSLFPHIFFFLCLFSFVYVVSGNETAAIRSKLLLESCTEMMISFLELLLLFFGERPLSLSDL